MTLLASEVLVKWRGERGWEGQRRPEETSSQVSMSGLSVPALLSTVETERLNQVFCVCFNQNSQRQIKVMNVTRACANPQNRAHGLAWEGEDGSLRVSLSHPYQGLDDKKILNGYLVDSFGSPGGGAQGGGRPGEMGQGVGRATRERTDVCHHGYGNKTMC